MARLVYNGVNVSVADEHAEALLAGHGFSLADGEKAPEPASSGYQALKVADLQAEIDRRNDGREEADLLSSEGKKADLIAALEADDNK